jgi:Bacterial Ig domain
MRQLFRLAMTRMLASLPVFGLMMLGAPAWGAVTAGSPAPGVPSYQSYTPTPAQIDQGKINSGFGVSAGEPSVGVDWATGKIMVQSDVQTLRITFDDDPATGAPMCPAYSTTTWEDKSAPTSHQDSDPILFTDHQTNRTISAMLLLVTGRNEASTTDDDGNTWTPAGGSAVNSGVDHETLGGGPFAPPLVGTGYANAFYYCSQLPAAACSLSTDGATTWGPAVPIDSGAACGGLHGHVKVSPVDGSVYVPNASCGGQQGLFVSTDNGATWSLSKIPDSAAGTSDPSVWIGAGGTIYFGYCDGGGSPKIAVGKLTALPTPTIAWAASTDVGTPFGIKNCEFAEVVAGDDDRAAFGFLGTPTAGGYQGGDFNGVWHFYVAHTYNQGTDWTVVDATPDDPVQRTCIWNGGGANLCRNLLDFNDINVDKVGRVVAVFADGCTSQQCKDAPASARGNDYRAQATLLRQTSGKRLFAAYDPVEPVAPGAAALTTARRDAEGVHLEWVEPSTGGAQITAYRVYRRTGASGSDSQLATLPASARSYLDATATQTGTYFYSVSAVNSAGETAACGLAASKVQPVDLALDPCVTPGVRVLTDPAGSQVGAPANADLDILSVAVAEPGDGSNLVFTMKVNADMSHPATPTRQWRIIWSYPGPPVAPVLFNGVYYAGMSTDNSNPPVVTFEYGTVELGVIGLVVSNPIPHQIATTTGDHLADGSIVINVPKSAVGNPQLRDILGGIYARTFDGSGTQTFRSTAAIDNTTQPSGSLSVTTTFGSYGVIGSCAFNSPPVAVDDVVTVRENGSLEIDVLANDADPDGDTLSVSIVAPPPNGTASVTGARRILYTPHQDFTGSDTLTYQDDDGHGNTATAHVFITVVPNVNHPPVAMPDSFSLARNTSITADVLANDYDPDGDPLTLTGVGPLSCGAVSIAGNKLSFTPNHDLTGRCCVDYTVTDAPPAGITPLSSTARACFDILCLVDSVFSDNFESGAPGWTVQTPVNPGTGAINWQLRSPDASAHSPTTDWYTQDEQNGAKDDRLISPVMGISSNSQLSFWHAFSTETAATGADGGSLEVSTDGGATWQEITAAGATFVAGGYNSTIAGEPAWQGSNASYPQMDQVTLDIGALAGLSRRFRFRFQNDANVGVDGWHVDDVQVTHALVPGICAPPPCSLTGDHLCFFTVQPCRVLDTRNADQGPAFGFEDRVVTLAGKCNVPITARAVAVNLTVTQPTGAGFLTLHADGTTPPGTSTINFSAGQTRANNAVTALSAAGDGTLRIFAAVQGQSPSVQVILDVNGYFE